jgi:hypothetical protein
VDVEAGHRRRRPPNFPKPGPLDSVDPLHLPEVGPSTALARPLPPGTRSAGRSIAAVSATHPRPGINHGEPRLPATRRDQAPRAPTSRKSTRSSARRAQQKTPSGRCICSVDDRLSSINLDTISGTKDPDPVHRPGNHFRTRRYVGLTARWSRSRWSWVQS